MEPVEMQDMINQILEIVPGDFMAGRLYAATPMAPNEFILAIIRDLVNERNKDDSFSVSSQPPSRDSVLVGHLQNAMDFIKSLSTATKDTETKKMISVQCEQIRDFIKEQDIKGASVPSVFLSEDYNAVVKSVADLANGETQESPMKEVFALFTGIVQMNAMLMERNKRALLAHEKLKQARDSENRNAKKDLTEKDKVIQSVRSTLLSVIDAKEGATLSEIADLTVSSLHSYQDICDTHKQTICDLKETLVAAREADHTEELTKKLKRAMHKISSLQKKIDQDEILNAHLMAEYEAQLNAATVYINNAEAKKAEHEATKKKLEKMRAFKVKATALQNDLNETERKRKELDTALEASTAQIKRAELQNKRLQDTIDTLRGEITKHEEKKKYLKSQIVDLENEKQQLIADANQRYNDLQREYDGTKAALEAELNSEREMRIDCECKIAEYEEKAAERQLATAKAKLSEREKDVNLHEALLSLTNATAQIAHQRDTYEAKINNLKDEHLAYIESSRKALLTALCVSSEQCPTLESAIECVFTEYDPILMDHARELKIAMDVKEGQTILDVFADIGAAMEHQDKELEANRTKLRQLKKQLIRANEKIAASKDDVAEMKRWTNWATGVYSFATDHKMIPGDNDALRKGLEDVLVSAANVQTVQRKMDILRSEKTALKRINVNTLTRPCQPKRDSLRPVVLVSMFAKRVMDAAKASKPPYVLDSSESGEM